MNEEDFEGSIVLEQLASMDLVDDFFDAIDSDDLDKVVFLLKKARIDGETIRETVDKIMEAQGEKDN